MAIPQIVALGGGGFSEEPDNTLLDDYILRLAGVQRPRVCFLPTASGDADGYVEKFYRAFAEDRCQPSHLSLFRPNQPDNRTHLLSQHVIYVGGGSTPNMLAVWRLHGLDVILREAWQAGVVLSGLSAGSLCWFGSGTTDAFGRGVEPLHDGLGFLPWSHSPHYDREPERRPKYQQWVASGVLSDGFAADDCAGLHFVGSELFTVVSSREDAQGYRVTKTASGVEEAVLPTVLLG